MLIRKTTWLVAIVAVGLTGCSDILFDEQDKTYDGPPVLEFAPIMPGGTYVAQVTFSAGSTDTETVDVGVNYVADPPPTDITGQVTAAGGSTATDGEHYTLAGRFTISAGENRATVSVETLASGLADGESVTLLLEMQTSTGGVAVSPNYDTFEIRISKEAS